MRCGRVGVDPLCWGQDDGGEGFVAGVVGVRRVGYIFAVLLAVVGGGGCGTTSVAPGAKSGQTAGSAEWTKQLTDFENRYFEFNPVFAVQQGRHEYDGRLPDWSAGGIRAEVQWLHAQRTLAEKF